MPISEYEKHKAKELLSNKFSKWKEMHFPSISSAEQATPEIVANYRASRVAGKIAVDLCCGIGIDSIALAKSFEKIYAFDLDKEVIECAKANAEVYKMDNIKFICSDYRKANLQEIMPDFAFADPSRRVEGKRVKALNETEPNTAQLIKFIKDGKVKNFCIETSHMLKPEELPENCEKEFITINGKPNCISLYFGEIKKSNFSVVDLPSKKRMEANEIENCTTSRNFSLRYLYELNEGITRFKMQKQVYDSLGKANKKTFIFQENFFGSAQKCSSPFFINSFKVLGEANSVNEMVDKLAKLKAGKIVLRGKFGEKEHVEMKKNIESKLQGSLKFHAFFFGEKIIIAQNLGIK